MGRNKFANSNVYEYFAVDSNMNSMAKFDIEQTRELFTGDKVYIKELSKNYDVTIDKQLDFSYDPYLY